MRRNVHNTLAGRLRWQLKGAVSIADRPAEVDACVVSGHWEEFGRRVMRPPVGRSRRQSV